MTAIRRNNRGASPILGAASSMIVEEAETLVTSGSRFRHSFEAAVVDIEPDPDQARETFDEDAIAKLAETMASEGQLQPILLHRKAGSRKGWKIVAGERRWRAAKHLGWRTMLAIECTGDPELAGLLENLQRVDLSPVEEARGLHRLIGHRGWTQSDAAAALGLGKSEVSGALRILTLPDHFLARVLTSELPLAKNVLVELARIDDSAALERLVAMAEDGSLTIKAIRTARREGEAGPADGQGAAEPVVEVAGTGEAGREPARQKAFSLVIVDRIADGLRMRRASGRRLDPAERERLTLLRSEIDATLAEADV